jgi:hypothetical protein
MIATRAATVLVAIIFAGWFGLSTWQAHNVNAVEAILANANGPSPAQARHASALLSSAATLNPDREVDLLRGELAFSLGDRQRATQIFLNVARTEPSNLEAWYGAANATTVPRTLRMVLLHIKALDPPLDRRR